MTKEGPWRPLESFSESPMSGDEVFIGILAGGFAALYWGGWLYSAFRTPALVHPGRRRAALLLVLLITLAVVAFTLLTGADPVVRASPGYVVLFLAVAAATLAGATVAAAAFGLNPLEQVVRGRNTAAGWAVSGLWLGTGLVNAGANVGRGDTIYTTLGPLALAFAALIGLAAVLAAATRGFRAVRLDRDGPAGVRLAGIFLAWGLFLGRGGAGDWESTSRTLQDVGRYAGVAANLLLPAAIFEWALRPTVRRPHTSWVLGIGAAVAYLIAAVAWAFT
jgi:hypothetical protein